MRKLLFEFEDMTWLPNSIRNGMTDFLQYLMTTFNLYDPVTPLLKRAIERTGDHHIIDLCSGGGGPLLKIAEQLQPLSEKEIRVTLSDKFPNLEKYNYISEKMGRLFSFERSSIDATAVPSSINAFRTMFSASHHFHPRMLKKILKNAADKNKGIAIFDGGSKNPLLILIIILTFPFLFLVLTPFLRPFNFTRLLFTYLIPIIPLFTIWDGIVSILRLHHPNDLLLMAKKIPVDGYNWEAGTLKNRLGIKIAYLIGYPEQRTIKPTAIKRVLSEAE